MHMEKRDYPVLRSADVTDAFPDIDVGPVVKAFPDIKVGDVLKLDGGALNLGALEPENEAGLVVLEPEAGAGLRIASAYVDSVPSEKLDEMLSELEDVVGTLSVTVIQAEASFLICEVIDVQATRGRSEM